VYELLREEGYIDWATTALFYASMHVVEAWLIKAVGTRSGSHGVRAQRMHRLGMPRAIFDAYDSLRKASELARYRDWSSVLDADCLSALHEGPYRLICEHLEAPETITPQ
jgi:HEPN domain-containing protein